MKWLNASLSIPSDIDLDFKLSNNKCNNYNSSFETIIYIII